MKLKKPFDDAETLSMISRRLGKDSNGIERRLKELCLNGIQFNGRTWYSKKETETLERYLTERETPKEYQYSIYDIKRETGKDYGTIKRCADYLNIKGFKDVHNKTFFNIEEKKTLCDFIKIHSGDEIQKILAKNTFQKKYGCDNPMQNRNVSVKLRKKVTVIEPCVSDTDKNEICDFLDELNVKYIKNDIILIPSKNVALEFDGLYYHSELFADKNYHLDKTLKCAEKGIDLIHIFEDDWKYRKEIVRSMIASRLGVYHRKVFARKCTVRITDRKTSERFFNENHLQGYAKTSDVHIGLFLNDELLQLMSFTMKGWHDGNIELTRMATILNTQVIGGFSRLMKHFCIQYNCHKVTSYIFSAWFNGKGYFSSGFRIVKKNDPSYSYIFNGERQHKSCFRKERLKEMYERGELKVYSDDMSEHEICNANGIYRIYDCGTVKVEYTY